MIKLLFLFINLSVAFSDVTIYFEHVPFYKTDLQKLCVVTLENIKFHSKETTDLICSSPENYRADVWGRFNTSLYGVFTISLSFGKTPLHVDSSSESVHVLTDKLLKERVFDNASEFAINSIHVQYTKIIPALLATLISLLLLIAVLRAALVYRGKQHTNTCVVKSRTIKEDDYARDAVASSGEPVCSICMINRARIAAVPCGHLCVCASCMKHINDPRCIICRKDIDTTLMIYF